jgi:UrcA family protein
VIRHLCPFCIAAVVGLAAPAAFAAEAQLSFGDLDLSKPADAAVLKDRIAAVAEKVCTAETPTGTRVARGVAECRRDTEAEIVSKLPPAARRAYAAKARPQAANS